MRKTVRWGVLVGLQCTIFQLLLFRSALRDQHSDVAGMSIRQRAQLSLYLFARSGLDLDDHSRQYSVPTFCSGELVVLSRDTRRTLVSVKTQGFFVLTTSRVR